PCSRSGGSIGIHICPFSSVLVDVPADVAVGNLGVGGQHRPGQVEVGLNDLRLLGSPVAGTIPAALADASEAAIFGLLKEIRGIGYEAHRLHVVPQVTDASGGHAALTAKPYGPDRS